MTTCLKARWLFACCCAWYCAWFAAVNAVAGPTGASAAAASGGPAPATLLPAEQMKAARKILSAYSAERLNAAQARALLESMGKAGLAPGPALNRVMADAGFSAKRVAQLAGNSTEMVKPAQAEHAVIVTPSGRTVPPRP